MKKGKYSRSFRVSAQGVKAKETAKIPKSHKEMDPGKENSCFVTKANRGKTSRASLTVRITVKNGDPSGDGKIWENRFFTGKMDSHGAKCTQIDEGTCQGVVCTCQNFFLFTNLAAGVTFLKVILQLLQNAPIWSFLISLAVVSYFSAPVFLTSLPHHCYIPTVVCHCMEENGAKKT